MMKVIHPSSLKIHLLAGETKHVDKYDRLQS